MMTPELQRRVDGLTQTQRSELRLILERIEALGRQALADLDEADLHALLDAIVAPTPREVASCMAPSELDAFIRLAKAMRKDTLTSEEASTAVPWLRDAAEVTRRVEQFRARPPSGIYDPDS
jgi:hypothetical protein